MALRKTKLACGHVRTTARVDDAEGTEAADVGASGIEAALRPRKACDQHSVSQHANTAMKV